MQIIESYPIAVMMCVITMICWGSWANTQKLASKQWQFQLFYWDYSLGIILISLILGMTMGSSGTEGRSFFADLGQANMQPIRSALIGGILFNLANILVVAAIDIAGMAVAFPVGIGLALVIGVITNYVVNPVGDPLMLGIGVFLVAFAIILDALIYRRLPSAGNTQFVKGLLLSIIAGVLMGFFYRFVAASMALDFASPEEGKLTPYSAVFIFSIGLFISNFLWNTWVMYKPFSGNAVSYTDYFKKGNLKLHFIGILGGLIWGLGMSFSIIASGAAGFAISYGLGQGATMVAAFWGVFIWKEFKDAPAGTDKFIILMFILFIIGLALIVAARLV